MKFRPCIDIHEGRVKQIVGSSLRDGVTPDGSSADRGACLFEKEGSSAWTGEAAAGTTASAKESAVRENFVSEKDASWYASFYRGKGLAGGHVIMLDHAGSSSYEATCRQAKSALREWPGGLMAGGGITPANAEEYLDAGASHVIVTSYVFRDGMIDTERLEEMRGAAGRDRLVLDLSCRRTDPGHSAARTGLSVSGDGEAARYAVATDRWQKMTSEAVTPELMERLAEYCAEFLVHAVDVEGKQSGIEEALLPVLAEGAKRSGLPVTYAGGIRNAGDISLIKELGNGLIDFTVGSALDIFGGELKFKEVLSLTIPG